eukprot:CAMPEP_0184691664 /NCGR_PEP_ID=MMETSP0313-20130426/442_1 /TAXON_ID=2792 /ORGANISM="Porphyridium aerugineum, Strain SAG 1380-2" /LENGTH=253 /DNA_ID=CAMNT_0027149419 /DNA_START=70 /DNA_END=831 /DNA_ORIENTATION=+
MAASGFVSGLVRNANGSPQFRQLARTSLDLCKALDSNFVSKEFSAAAATGIASYKLPDLPYDYAALEPVIDAKTMLLHHSKHHNTYVQGLNKALETLDKAIHSHDVNGMIGVQNLLRFHGGGHLNHSIFWTNLCPADKSVKPKNDSELGKKIVTRFGSVDSFISEFNTKAAGIQGSGWGWLAYNPASKSVDIVTMSNQDPLQPSTGLVPLLGIDMWEHAFYLKYQNDKATYLKNIWQVVNWANVEERLAHAIK